MHRLTYILILVLLSSCHEYFVPIVETSDPILTIEGNIGTLPKKYEVTIMLSTFSGEVASTHSVNDAVVHVEDSEGNIYEYTHVRDGRYTIQLNANNVAQPGLTYTLYVHTSDGNEFVSEPQLLVPCSPIDSLYCTSEEIVNYSVDVDGEMREKEVVMMQVYFATEGILPENNYYNYTIRAVSQYQSLIKEDEDSFMGRTLYEFKGVSTNVILTENADRYQDNIVEKKYITGYSVETLESHTPLLDSGEFLSYTSFEGMIFELNQLSVSADAYDFYRQAETILESDGHLFDPQETRITSNIKCENNPDKQVIGVFSASDISQSFAYLYVGAINRERYAAHSEKLDYFWPDSSNGELYHGLHN